MSVSLRAAQSGDAAAISGILAESWKKAYVGMVPQDYLDRLDGSKWERLKGDLSSGNLSAFLLLEDGIPAGAAGYGKSRDEKLPDWGEIQFLYIRPGFCHRGYGGRLLRAATDALAERGFPNCFLWVLEGNKNARDFYVAAGFRGTKDLTHSEIMGKRLTEMRFVFPAP